MRLKGLFFFLLPHSYTSKKKKTFWSLHSAQNHPTIPFSLFCIHSFEWVGFVPTEDIRELKYIENIYWCLPLGPVFHLIVKNLQNANQPSHLNFSLIWICISTSKTILLLSNTLSLIFSSCYVLYFPKYRGLYITYVLFWQFHIPVDWVAC